MERSPIPIGSKFSRLTVTGPAVKDGVNYKVPAVCDCGKTGLFLKSLLRFGTTRSCGCLKSDSTAARNAERGKVWTAGDTAGRLTVTSVTKKAGETYLTVVCTCGTQKEMLAYNLAKGKTSSCGCLRREMVADKNTTHGMAKTKVYRVWRSMLDRCSNVNVAAYKHYGGRGISVSEAWSDFNQFYADMGDVPFPGASIDRIDNEAGYSVENCRWATKREQLLNTRRSVVFHHLGRDLPLDVIAEEVGINEGTLYYRINTLGLAIDEAIAYKRHSQPTTTPS